MAHKRDVGDRARVIANENCHYFDIGAVVEIIELQQNGTYPFYYATKNLETPEDAVMGDHDTWCIADEELEDLT